MLDNLATWGFGSDLQARGHEREDIPALPARVELPELRSHWTHPGQKL